MEPAARNNNVKKPMKVRIPPWIKSEEPKPTTRKDHGMNPP
jgi:hypothetical protein